MTPSEVRLARASFPAIYEMAGPVALLFYGRLFDLDPALRALFHVDMRKQSKKLMDTLETIVSSLDRFEEMRPVLRELGAKHVGYGVKPQDYDTLSAALIWTLGQALGTRFDDEMREAWRSVIGAINEEMQRGAACAPSHE